LAEALSPGEVVRSGLCIGCGSCASGEPRATMRWDAHGFLKPEGPANWYEAPSEAFAATCPFSPTAADEDVIAGERFPGSTAHHPAIGRFEAAYVGAAAEPPFREQGSSGGLVTWAAAELLRSDLVDAVAHVVPGDPDPGGFFGYTMSRSVEALNRGAKSRYYPIELSGVLREVRSTPGRYAVVGIPCFIKAVHLARRNDPILAERITHTLALFCGHMKSARLVESFAWQLGRGIGEVAAVDYRLKDAGRPANWYRAQLSLKGGGSVGEDWWNLADGDWGAGFFQASACNWCDDVVGETADMSFGDAWVEPHSSDGRGTNVAVVRSAELLGLVEAARGEGRLALEPVDAAFVEQTQAAGFRHRREGLAYRLTWANWGLRPRKRVEPSADGLPWRRRLVYRTRYAIAGWSNRVFAVARRLRWPGLYTRWARAALSFYAGVTWSRGWVGKVADRLESWFPTSRSP
jgi:coenzyme F420-reducing hydrogenase beta subunit